MIVDLHVNLEAEDGALVDPEELATAAKTAGLDGMVLTQEGVMKPDLEPYRAAADAQGLTVLRGARLATNHGWILCIFPDGADLGADWAEMDGEFYDANSVIDGAEARGGATIALRPYDRDLSKPMGDHLFVLHGLSACEVQNTDLSESVNALALEAASSMEMPCIGSSGARGTEGLGSCATLLRDPVSSETQLIEVIRSGDCWPVTFSDRVPAGEPANGRGRPRGARDGQRSRDAGGGRGRGGGGGGGRSGAQGRRGRGSSGGAGRDAPAGRSRKRRRGRVGPRPDDFGNRAGPSHHPVDDNIGNRVSPNERLPDEDIGNRLRPGEVSPYRNKSGEDED